MNTLGPFNPHLAKTYFALCERLGDELDKLTEELRREKQVFEMECATHRHDLGLLHQAGLEAYRYRDALQDIATSVVSAENHGACALVDKALRALQSE